MLLLAVPAAYQNSDIPDKTMQKVWPRFLMQVYKVISLIHH